MIDASTGQTYDAAPGSAVLPKEMLAQIIAYVKIANAYHNKVEICLERK